MQEQFDWDKQYESGKWKYLGGSKERPRFEFVKFMTQQAVSQTVAPSILEIGCGTGVLLSYLHNFLPPSSSYTASDISSYAIDEFNQTASKLNNKLISINPGIVSTAEDFSIIHTEQYDCIIVNECLYYFDKPEEVLIRLEKLLKPGGYIIISVFMGNDIYNLTLSGKKLINDVFSNKFISLWNVSERFDIVNLKHSLVWHMWSWGPF
jgi:2-polyprenyl-3-methyl-5-hydroxy-6-metoxy-1,4-benzoquinol methylase